MEQDKLDFLLVPIGLLLLVLYHVWLLYTIVKNPTTTVIGLNAKSRYQWVFAMMSVSPSFLSLIIFKFFFLLQVFEFLDCE